MSTAGFYQALGHSEFSIFSQSKLAISHNEMTSPETCAAASSLSIIDYSSVPDLAVSALVHFAGDFAGGQGYALTAANKFVYTDRD